jgi:hypothetical protein
MSEANGEDVVLDDWAKSKTKAILESMIIKEKFLKKTGLQLVCTSSKMSSRRLTTNVSSFLVCGGSASSHENCRPLSLSLCSITILVEVL